MAKMRFWTGPRLLYPLIILLLAGLLACGYFYFLRPVTTVILVRHAEKNIEPDNPNPDLSAEGRARAQELVHILGGTGVTAIYATQYGRTQQTVQPLAERLSLPVSRIDSGNTPELVRQIKASHAGGVVFVAGHNSTVPAIIAALGGGTYPTIPETEYDNMFVVTLYRFRKASTVKMKYGSAAPAQGNQQMMRK